MNTVLNDISIQRADQEELARINQLLGQADLPLVDSHEFTDNFFVAHNQDEEVLGAIGLEIYGSFGLLRSMVVNPGFRNKGIAAGLVDKILETSAKLGLHEVYLLTNTAEKYFERKGFEYVSREGCPYEIRQSREFSSICPVSSFLMSRKTSK